MVEIKWTNFAIQNLTDIGDFIERDSCSLAAKFVNYLFDSVDILERYPFAGRIVPEYNCCLTCRFFTVTTNCLHSSGSGNRLRGHSRRYASSLLLQRPISAATKYFWADGSLSRCHGLL